MIHINNYSDFSLNESIDNNFINKSIIFIEKIKHLISDITISDDDIKKIINKPISNTIYSLKYYYAQVKEVVTYNEPEIKRAYDSVFGVNEEICLTIFLSVAIMLAFYWASKKGYLDRFFRKIDKNYDTPSCRGGNETPSWKSVNKTLSIDDILDKISKKGYNSLTKEEKEKLKMYNK